MKKFLLTAMVAVFALAANAQVWVGGSIGASTSKTTADGIKDVKINKVTIAPTIGYTLDENWDIAAEISYSHKDKNVGKSSNTFGFAPYARYKYFKIGKFAAFADGGFSYANEHICGDSESVNIWGIGIAPGVSYDLNNKISIDARLGGIGWEFSKYGDVKTNKFGFDLDNELKLGIYFKF